MMVFEFYWSTLVLMALGIFVFGIMVGIGA